MGCEVNHIGKSAFHLYLTCSLASRFLAGWWLEVFTAGAGEALVILRTSDLKMHIRIA